MDILKKNFINKFIILTLCFTIIFSSVNLKKVDAIDFVISPTILAVVSTLAVGTGIVLKNSDDIYDIGRLFYDYVERNNELTWDIVKTTFESAKVVNDTILVNSGILDVARGFFDSEFKGKNFDKSFVANSSVPFFNSFSEATKYASLHSDFLNKDAVYAVSDFKSQGIDFKYISHNHTGSYPSATYDLYLGNTLLFRNEFVYASWGLDVTLVLYKQNSKYYFGMIRGGGTSGQKQYTEQQFLELFGAVGSLPYSGGYDWDTNVEDKKEGTGDLPLPIPGNLGDLVGKNPSDVWDKNYENGLVGNGNLSFPNVDNPSIGLGGSTSFPTTDTGVGNPSVPGTDTGTGTDINTGIWATIKDFIISLVVPSDTFWTDTWNGLYNNFTGSFPGVDMGGFNDLVTGEKKFPNIDINIMGVKGRVVNGDVINSIVDWLRPIIAGFMMLCLMFFNYRKIYKLIRNSEPFGGISPGTSDFSTGISEYSDNYLKGGK